MKFQIDRAKWLRGEGGHESALLRTSDGKMCCLGFYCLARGVPAEDVRDFQSPRQVCGAMERVPELVLRRWSGDVTHPDLVWTLMSLNDSELSAKGDREAEITRLFAQIQVDGQPVEVEFVN